MLRINNRGFKRSYVYGGTGIFDSIAKAAVSLLPVVQKGALQVGKKLGEKGDKRYHLSYLNLEINHQSLRRLNLSRFVQVQRIRSVALQNAEDPPRLTSKSQDILRKYTGPLDPEHRSAAPPPPPSEQNFNLNALIDGSAIG